LSIGIVSSATKSLSLFNKMMAAKTQQQMRK